MSGQCHSQLRSTHRLWKTIGLPTRTSARIPSYTQQAVGLISLVRRCRAFSRRFATSSNILFQRNQSLPRCEVGCSTKSQAMLFCKLCCSGSSCSSVLLEVSHLFARSRATFRLARAFVPLHARLRRPVGLEGKRRKTGVLFIISRTGPWEDSGAALRRTPAGRLRKSEIMKAATHAHHCVLLGQWIPCAWTPCNRRGSGLLRRAIAKIPHRETLVLGLAGSSMGRVRQLPDLLFSRSITPQHPRWARRGTSQLLASNFQMLRLRLSRRIVLLRRIFASFVFVPTTS